MKTVAFLLGSPEISGGTNVIYEHASRMHNSGFQVTILTESPVSSNEYSWHPAACSLNWLTYDEATATQFDFVIATWWQSVFKLEQITGRYYVYFVQSIESRFFPLIDPDDPDTRDADIVSEWCESTYWYPLPVITEAGWIATYLKEKYNRNTHLVLNGIRKDCFHENGRVEASREPSKLRVLIEGPLGVFFKNVEKTIELCIKAKVPEIWLLTSSDVTVYPGVTRCFSKVPIEKTPEIYRSCDVLVKLSYVEGMFGPPLEMFHCGGTAIVYDVTGHEEYIRDGENSIVVQKDDEKGVVDWLLRLQDDSALLKTLKEGARKTAENWRDWDVAAQDFGETLHAIEADTPVFERVSLQQYNKITSLALDNGFCARELQRYSERERNFAKESLSIKNSVQLYWSEGEGLSPAIIKQYSSGNWQTCCIDVPASNGPVTLRIDPSVRIGIVAIKYLEVYEKDTGKILRCYDSCGGWNEITFAGTMVCLQKQPYPVINAFGEDPQMFLPEIPQFEGQGGLAVKMEVLEMSFTEHYQRFSNFICREGSFKHLVCRIYKKITRKVFSRKYTSNNY